MIKNSPQSPDAADNSLLRLTAEQLFQRCDPAQFSFETTADVKDLPEVMGQARAVDAIQFGIGIQREGYNLFVMGPTGSGRHAILRRFVDEKAALQPVVCDWCYVHRFADDHKPRALMLPPGRGRKLAGDMERLVNDLRTAIPAALTTDSYRAQLRQIQEEFTGREERAMADLRANARQQDVAVISTPTGFEIEPMKDGQALSVEEFQACPEDERERIKKNMAEVESRLGEFLETIPRWRHEAKQKIRDLKCSVAKNLVNNLIDGLRKDYADCPAVLEYLIEVQDDVVENIEIFLQSKESEQLTILGIPVGPAAPGESPFRRYRVNVLIDHGDDKGAPVIYEDNPTHDNLIGRIEFIHQIGVLVTDFLLIKPGALHRANGGYLILDAMKVLLQPFAWEALKRALRSREIRIESLGQALSLISTVSLEPQPIPLDVKVVLVGEREIYYLLHHFDPEFGELFKVAADLEEQMTRSPEATEVYARLISTLVRKDSLRPLDRTAVARVIEHSSRIAGDAEKLSVGMQRITDLLREADYFAGTSARRVVGAGDVQRAIDAQEHRAGRLRERLHEEIQRGTLLIESTGDKVAQANAMSVIELNGFAFGYPSRITARVRLGGGKVVNIEREVELSGPIHSKGVLILAGFLSGRYIPDRPLSLTASLVFEQSYGGVEGDSASLAELCVLLSALADAPIRQSLAITGSIDQHGRVQAVGGVNEKIEGFFDICNGRGLNGEHGVLIPATNIKHLMLRQDVVDAVAAGKFHVSAVSGIDQAMELLTGVSAGERAADGLFPAETLNHRVEQRLIAFAKSARAFHAPGGGEEEAWRAPRHSKAAKSTSPFP